MAGFRDSQATLVVSLVGGSHVVNHMYFMLLPPIVPFAARAGLTGAQIGIAAGLLGFVVSALQLPLGHLSDTKGRTPVLAISLGCGAVGAALVALVDGFAWLLVAVAVLGVGIAGHHPAHYPLLSAATDESERGRAFSVHGFTGAVGFALPPLIVGGAAELGLGWRVGLGAIAAVGGLYAVGCLATLVGLVDDDITDPSDTSRAGETWSAARVVALPRRAASGLADMLDSRGIVLVTVLWFATSMAAWGIKYQTLPLLVDGYGLAESTGNFVVFAMLGVGAVLMLAGGWLVDRTSPKLVLTVGYVAFVGIALTLSTAMLPIVLAVGLTLLLAATIDYSRPGRAGLADRLSSSDSMGKSFGLVTIGISGGSAVAPPVLGVIERIWSVEVSFVAMAGLGIVALALLAVVLRVDGEQVVPRPRPTDD